MKKSKYSETQIVAILKEADAGMMVGGAIAVEAAAVPCRNVRRFTF